MFVIKIIGTQVILFKFLRKKSELKKKILKGS